MTLQAKLAIQSVLRRFGYLLIREKQYVDRHGLYANDGLLTIHNHDFMDSAGFQDAYARGLQAAEGADPCHHWRVHIAVWAAKLALRARGEFVECGVNVGFMSSAIMRALDWNALERRFFLVDSFTGPRLEDLGDGEVAAGRDKVLIDAMRREAYVTDLSRIRENFSEWPSATIVQGFVPEVLHQVSAERLAFLHLDMNVAAPEKAALEFFWPMLSGGSVILLDDYAYQGYEIQKEAIDQVGEEKGFDVLSLPTGQGLIIK